MKRKLSSYRSELRAARHRWVDLDREQITELRKFLCANQLSVVMGDVLYLYGHWYVTHSGLLRLAQRKHCLGIRTIPEFRCSDASMNRWVFKAIVYKSTRLEGFCGLRRRRSLKCLSPRSRRRDASRRDPRRQSSTPESLWHRSLLGRRAWLGAEGIRPPSPAAMEVPCGSK